MATQTSATKLALAAVASTAITLAITTQLLSYGIRAKNNQEEVPACLYVFPKIAELIAHNLDKISNEALIKLVRQLDFWHKEGLTETELLKLAERLVRTATLIHTDFKVPTVRYGKTELQMPIVTCGGMRLQETWLPDSLPIAKKASKVLKGASQENLKQAIRICLKMGINHFETARFYGTSELQFTEVLYEMIQAGEIQRSDFILQTKIPPTETIEKFEEMWNSSWKHMEKLEYIDLFAFHCVSSKFNVSWVLSDAEDMCMAFIKKRKEEGKIRHIGFSTHGTASNIMELINSEKFAFVNLHCHYFGDYHAEGTPNTLGGHGNHAAVKRALELDMGVFNISPIDKGGMMYAPSRTVARLIGPELSPISFVSLHSWKTNAMHTVSIGFARPSDIDEALEAAWVHSQGNYEKQLEEIERRLDSRKKEVLGKPWVEKGMLNVSSCEDERTNGTGLGHILWCHNIVSAFGMYDFARARYGNMETMVKWNEKKSFEENLKAMMAGNMGRPFVEGLDYSKAVDKHYDPDAVLLKLEEAHAWLRSGNKMSPEQLKKLNCEKAYDLRIWNSFPGDNPTMTGVLLQALSGGWFGSHGSGPTTQSIEFAGEIRAAVQKA